MRVPKRGVFKQLVEMACDNARAMMDTSIPRYKREADENLQAMEELAQALGLPGLPMRIEGYDISNISGKEAVASMVVLYNGKADKSSYRRFRIKTGDTPNDVAMMQEVLWRRFRRGLDDRAKLQKPGSTLTRKSKFAVFPDLVIVDGGKGQVNAAKQVLDELGLDIPVAALAEKNEELFLPGVKDPVILPRDSGAFVPRHALKGRSPQVCLGVPPETQAEEGLGYGVVRDPRIRAGQDQAAPQSFWQCGCYTQSFPTRPATNRRYRPQTSPNHL